MKTKYYLALTLLCGGAGIGHRAYAQAPSKELNFGPDEGVVDVITRLPNGPRGPRNTGSQGQPGQSAYPAFDRASADYQRADQAYKQAYQRLQNILNKDEDEDTSISPSEDEDDARLQLAKAQYALNAAWSRVRAEFQKASEQYAREVAAQQEHEHAVAVSAQQNAHGNPSAGIVKGGHDK